MQIDIDGRCVGYDDAGRGMPVVFLHGFPHDRSLWAQQRIALSSRVRCIVPDLRGFGESDGVAHDVDTYADDTVALLDALGVEDAIVCGLSMGGYIAMAMWRRHPTRVRGLVLCDTRAGADTPEGRAARNANIAKARDEGAAAIARAQIGKMVGEETTANRPDVVTTVKRMMERQSVAAITGALQALRDRPDSRETVASISVPTLVLVGEHDVLTPPADAEELLALLPPRADGRLETIAGAGHVSCLERPAAVTLALADFLATFSQHG
ncbi:MAG TPA: alpha/beta fold hydrolase [Gemmatimonas sp.]|nr:alpha/beta fold hydrolase [Gemmatimonas sp.]